MRTVDYTTETNKEMNLKFLTIQGESVPALGFGTWQMHGNACVDGVAHALSLGYRHIDTAQAYNNEEQVGEGIRKSGVDRDSIFLVTKVQERNFKHNQVISTTEESLRKLGVDYVDLLLMHWPNPDVPLRETLGAFKELQTNGSIRHIGVSNFSSSLVDDAQLHANIFSNQVEYHPYQDRSDLLQQAKEMDYMLTAYSPLDRGGVLEDPVLSEIGERYGKNTVQVSLRWLLQQGVAAIPKASDKEHRESNFDVFDFTLSDEEMQAIFALSS